MYDTPFRSYDAQLGRFHQIDPLADLAPGINPYRFGFNNPISLNDPIGLYEGSIQDIFDEAWARTPVDVGYFTFNNGSLNRDTSTENDINWVVDFVTSEQGTAEFMMDSSGGGFWLHYNPSFVGGYVGSRNEHVGAIIQKRSLFFSLGQQSGTNDGLDIYDISNLALNTVNGVAYIIDVRQLSDLLTLPSKGQGFINSIGTLSTALQRVGVGTSIVSGVLSVRKYNSIEIPTWGDKTELGVGITSAILSVIPHTTFLGIGIGLIDVAGGFDPLYDLMNVNENLYKNHSILLLWSPTGVLSPVGF
jgi:hypothetical protein